MFFTVVTLTGSMCFGKEDIYFWTAEKASQKIIFAGDFSRSNGLKAIDRTGRSIPQLYVHTILHFRQIFRRAAHRDRLHL